MRKISGMTNIVVNYLRTNYQVLRILHHILINANYHNILPPTLRFVK